MDHDSEGTHWAWADSEFCFESNMDADVEAEDEEAEDGAHSDDGVAISFFLKGYIGIYKDL